MKKKVLSLVMAAAMVFSMTACSDEYEEDPVVNDDVETSSEESSVADVPDDGAGTQDVAAGEGSWAIYWYLCGSDLESGGGFASGDLGELMEVQLPENVNVVIETGGSSEWQNDVIDASKLQRWVYNSEGLMLVDEQPSASMGEAQTLADFLSFAKTNYPAEKTAVVFWNHGGGSVSGASFDEL